MPEKQEIEEMYRCYFYNKGYDRIIDVRHGVWHLRKP